MKNDLIVVVDELNDWKPYFPSDQIVSANDYLFDEKRSHCKRVINLCRNRKYLSLGYYVSLFAESNSQRAIPSLKTLNDLRYKKFYKYDLEEFESLIQKALDKSKELKEMSSFDFLIFFGKVKNKSFKKIGQMIFNYYPAPIIKVHLSLRRTWRIESLQVLSLSEIQEDNDQEFFAKSFDQFSNRIWRTEVGRKKYQYDLAILVDKSEEMAPSNDGAMNHFMKAANNHGFYVEVIESKDLNRLSEFDALFIRQTTAVNNITYLFAKKAKEEGIVVIDDPDSILKCTNKIYLSKLLERNKISIIPSYFVSSISEEAISKVEIEIGYPAILKIPDGSFSRGIHKAEDRASLKEKLRELLAKSTIVLVQKFLYTDFDWRIGIFNKQFLFACKYFMSEGHWRIYNHENDKDSESFSGGVETLPREKVPQHVLKEALAAANLIGDSLYGVDLKDDGQQAFVVEVNDNPNIDEGVEDLYLEEKLYDLIIKEFKRRIIKEKESF